MKRLVLILALFLLPATSTLAEGRIVSAGTATLFGVNPISNENVVDIYTRQLQYHQQRLKFRQTLEARQISYARLPQQALSNYRSNLKAMNASRTDWRGDTQ